MLNLEENLEDKITTIIWRWRPVQSPFRELQSYRSVEHRTLPRSVRIAACCRHQTCQNVTVEIPFAKKAPIWSNAVGLYYDAGFSSMGI